MNWKRISRALIVLFAVTAVGGIVIGNLWIRMHNDPVEWEAEAVTHIRAHGISHELVSILERTPRPHGWVGTVVLATPSEETNWQRGIVAAYPEVLTGQTEGEAFQSHRSSRHHNQVHRQTSSVTAPDGQQYTVAILQTYNPLPLQLSEGIAHWALMLGWLSLAAWIFIDVRERPAAPALPWLLLALLTGPLALAAWLISRPDKSEPHRCPGCGTDVIKGAAFCVQCGHGVSPACPSCRRPVAIDWHHCAACGSSVTE